MNANRKRALESVAGMAGFYAANGLQKPTVAEVENMLLLVSDRSIELTAEQWARLWKLGSRRLAQLQGVMIGYLHDDGDDIEVTALLRMLRGGH